MEFGSLCTTYWHTKGHIHLWRARLPTTDSWWWVSGMQTSDVTPDSVTYRWSWLATGEWLPWTIVAWWRFVQFIAENIPNQDENENASDDELDELDEMYYSSDSGDEICCWISSRWSSAMTCYNIFCKDNMQWLFFWYDKMQFCLTMRWCNVLL